MKYTTPAERLLHELGVSDPQEIDLEAIAWHSGARVDYRPLDGCEAQIIGFADKAVIVVNERSHPKRKRFSIAHELGHWHHHRGQSSVCRTADIENYSDQAFARERVADKYAADLLLPAYLFVPRANAVGNVTVDAASTLADTFGTSLTASVMRLVDMGPELSVLVCHGPDGRKWFRRGEGVPEHWCPRLELDARSAALNVVFGKKDRSRRVLVSATYWFGCRDARQVDLFEETIKVGPSAVLTLLVFKDNKLSEQ